MLSLHSSTRWSQVLRHLGTLLGQGMPVEAALVAAAVLVAATFVIVAVTGQMVVLMGTVTVTTAVEWAGQLVTVDAQLMMVETEVV